MVKTQRVTQFLDGDLQKPRGALRLLRVPAAKLEGSERPVIAPFLDPATYPKLLKNYDLDVSSDVDSVLSNIAGALLKYAGKDPKRKIDSFATWLEAFIIFASYRGYYHPGLYPKLISYIGIINGLSGQMGSANLWLEYINVFE
ncbi:hypothetical protein RvY_09914 [Ramazzottius varieornatus]|uniref:Uncharacterized protein n=1 Tax=Ramazzottius varieornatus TaxID=947166 RepID=A0A1D1VAZ7_RAMVA|nr:hypothetical protein RvY_09914 [Ramazzottius varieornatus]